MARPVRYRPRHRRATENDNLIGTNSPIGEQRRFVEVRSLAQIEDLDLRPQQLAGVFVAGDDPDLMASRDGLSRQRRDHVVGFPSGGVHCGKVKGFDRFDEKRNLRPQVLGHLAAVGLVLGIELLPLTNSLRFQGTDQPRWPMDLQQRDQVTTEPEHGVRRLSRRAGHGWDRMEHLKHQREGVDQENGVGHGMGDGG